MCAIHTMWHVACFGICVLFYFSFVCFEVYAYVFKFKVHSGSALGLGTSGLPCYCAPLVCVPAVLGRLAVWRHNKPKTNNQLSTRLVQWLSWVFTTQEKKEEMSPHINERKKCLLISMISLQWCDTSVQTTQERKERILKYTQIHVSFNDIPIFVKNTVINWLYSAYRAALLSPFPEGAQTRSYETILGWQSANHSHSLRWE